MRKVRHVYAKDDEYIAVHRNNQSTSYSSSRGSYSSSGLGAEGCGCLIAIVIFLIILSGC